jgi:hypothetical protein
MSVLYYVNFIIYYFINTLGYNMPKNARNINSLQIQIPT